MLRNFFLIDLFWGCVACGILVPQPGMESTPLAVEVWKPNLCTGRELLGTGCLCGTSPMCNIRKMIPYLMKVQLKTYTTGYILNTEK